MWRDKKRQAKKKIFFKKIIFLILLLLAFTFGFVMIIRAVGLLKKERFISPLPKDMGKNVAVKPSAKSNDTQVLSQLLKDRNISFLQVTASDAAYIVVLSNGSEIILSSEKELANQVTSLQLVLTRLTIEGKGFSRLDLRFDKPVVVFH